jgi:hypothetical protein
MKKMRLMAPVQCLESYHHVRKISAYPEQTIGMDFIRTSGLLSRSALILNKEGDGTAWTCLRIFVAGLPRAQTGGVIATAFPSEAPIRGRRRREELSRESSTLLVHPAH